MFQKILFRDSHCFLLGTRLRPFSLFFIGVLHVELYAGIQGFWLYSPCTIIIILESKRHRGGFFKFFFKISPQNFQSMKLCYPSHKTQYSRPIYSGRRTAKHNNQKQTRPNKSTMSLPKTEPNIISKTNTS